MKLDHVFFSCRDMQAVERFFTDIVGLQPGSRPDFPFPGAWLYADAQPVVHLAAAPLAATKALKGKAAGAIGHFALRGGDHDVLMRRLHQTSTPYTCAYVPQTKEMQLFIQGPEGITVERSFPARTRSGQ